MARLLFIATAIALCAVASANHGDPNMADGRRVMVQLMSWKWTDIAEECERYLGPNGFGGVQISPPNEHAIVTHPFRPWWERYMPVSYELHSRSGTEDELRDMVTRCNEVGVRIYADVVINHMAYGEMAEGSAGNPYDPETFSYPQVPYAAQDFSVPNHKCPSESGNIDDFNDVTELRDCNLVGLLDLDTSVAHVRYTIANYMNRLIDIGVAGFHVSNAENIWPHDLKIIYESLHNLSTTFFQLGSRPFVFQEVKTTHGSPINSVEYLGIGVVTEFKYGQIISDAVRGEGKTLASLRNLEDELVLMPSSGAVVFVDNPATQRVLFFSTVIHYNERRLYEVANAFMLAYPYGLARVMSSFMFSHYDEGPPMSSDGETLSPTINVDGLCGNGWVCEHRWKEIKNMVGFRNAAEDQPLANWWSNDNQQIAFGRGDRAFIVLNNEPADLSKSLYTGLPPGEYCDIMRGDFNAQSRICTGPQIKVDDSGFASFTLDENDVPMCAVHVNARVSNEVSENYLPQIQDDNPTTTINTKPPTTKVPPNPPSIPPSIPVLNTTTNPLPQQSISNVESVNRRTTIFVHKSTNVGQNLFVLGGIGHDHRKNCTDQANTSACAIPITHLTPGDNAQYNAWKTGDNYLDWYGAEVGQSSYENIQAEGTPLVWTTNDPSHTANVATNGYGYTPLNQFGNNYWMVDLEMDCARAEDGWFELKAFLMDERRWENDISQVETCTGSVGGSKPYAGINHFARCGFINVFEFGENECTIDAYGQDSGHEVPTVPEEPTSTTNDPITDPGTSSLDPSNGLTTIFIHKSLKFGQNLFIRGGIDHKQRKNCTDQANTSACVIPITHLTPGDNAQYNAWKTGDNYLDWYGAEVGQSFYEKIQSEGTPLVWTTNDPSHTANVANNGYGYSPLNQWGDNYWMVQLQMDCSKTEDGWFELKAFVMDGQEWENDISQQATCDGYVGGSKPYNSTNHFARCGFTNVFNFGENGCIIDDNQQAISKDSVASFDGKTTHIDSPQNDVRSNEEPPLVVTTSDPFVNNPVNTVQSESDEYSQDGGTIIFVHKSTNVGQNLFILGGIGHDHRKNCTNQANTSACAIPITHLTPGDNAQYNAWKTGDNYLDWYGAEVGQSSYEKIQAKGTPLVWTTNDPSHTANVATNGYGYTPLNQFGDNYWMVDLEMDCTKTEDGWFELKAFVMDGQGWENDISQVETCDGSVRGSKPYAGINHFARCGSINIFEFGENECTIEAFGQDSGHEVPTVPGEPTSTTNDPITDPGTSSLDLSNGLTTIFVHKSLQVGQNLFIRGGIGHEHRENCTDQANTSACAIPITHLTPGDNAQYNAWKTGDNYLDWYGAEVDQNSYENIQAEGTPLVWTTNDPNHTANVVTNGYGYTPLNQWGDHYWMVQLNLDCSKTKDGWFELKAFVMDGQGWENDIYQQATCDGSVGGSKPYNSTNHFARCGFTNIFNFGENGCVIDDNQQTISEDSMASFDVPNTYIDSTQNDVRSNEEPPLVVPTSDPLVNNPVSTVQSESDEYSQDGRTIIFVHKLTNVGQNLFILGGIDHKQRENCTDQANTSACAIPITHLTPGDNAQYNAWKTGDNYLDWYGAEVGQSSYEKIQAKGTPLVWTTNDPSHTANVATNGYGYTPLNQFGDNYWMVDLEMDCTKTEDGWFELKAFVMDGQGWENDISQVETCAGSVGGSKPYAGINHFARCGSINIFEFGENECTIETLGHDSGHEVPTVPEEPTSTTNDPITDPGTSNLDPFNGLTTIFVHKSLKFGQNLFIRGGIGHEHRENCTDQANTSACAIPITHLTPGDNAQYNAWKTGDNYLDWYGAEVGQSSYEKIQAKGTPLVWTTNDPSHTANVATNGYGYTPLNQFGDNYWMVDLEMDCTKTEDGWFELKAFVMDGQGWENDISQVETCAGSVGGSKPYAGINHFARCGSINIFEFGENECTIEALGHDSGHEVPTVPEEPTSTTNDPITDPGTSNLDPFNGLTTIFVHKSLQFGQNLFIRGGIGHEHRENCTDQANTSACAIPITHLTPGDNAQYNAWKTGDNHLDWYGAEVGQSFYENIQAEGTPLVWTTNDPSHTANVATNGYGYTSLNQWGDNYWMVQVNLDCSKTEDGWFELKAFVMDGQEWENDISQQATCDGSVGGSKPYNSTNHFARCSFTNVFNFGENGCTIDS